MKVIKYAVIAAMFILLITGIFLGEWAAVVYLSCIILMMFSNLLTEKDLDDANIIIDHLEHENELLFQTNKELWERINK